MELRQLEYFVAVAEEASFTRAAQRVHISQSGVSAQVGRLERELGAPLIDRSGRRATLTAAGAHALEHARAVLASARAVRAAVDDVNGLVRGRLVVGMVAGCTITPLFEALAAFRRAHAGVEVCLLEDESARLVEGLRAGVADLVLAGVAGPPPADLESLTIVSEPIVAAVAAGHPLAARPRIALADLAPHQIICLPEGTGIRAVFDRACAAAGVTPDVPLQASAPDAVADLARRDLGVAVLSASMVAGDDDLLARTIDDAPEPAVLALLWRPVQTPALRALLEHARGAFAGVRGPSPAPR